MKEPSGDVDLISQVAGRGRGRRLHRRKHPEHEGDAEVQGRRDGPGEDLGCESCEYYNSIAEGEGGGVIFQAAYQPTLLPSHFREKYFKKMDKIQ